MNTENEATSPITRKSAPRSVNRIFSFPRQKHTFTASAARDISTVTSTMPTEPKPISRTGMLSSGEASVFPRFRSR